MSSASGGVAAAFGFRYQYLVTVQILLDLYSSDVLCEWYVDVDLSSQDSADILVSRAGAGWDLAIQVKASQPEAGTTMGPTEARRILDRLAREHSRIPKRCLVTNRDLTKEFGRVRENGLLSLRCGEEFVHIEQRLPEIFHEALERISTIRRRGAGGLNVGRIVLDQLISLVFDRGSDKNHQRITRCDVDKILREPAAVLADSNRGRSWGRTIQLPQGRPIARPVVDFFLEQQLPLHSLETGNVSSAVLKGLSGTGKSSAAQRIAHERLENLAFVLWMDASSETSLLEQLPLVMNELTTNPVSGDSAADFTRTLSEVPVPWLLILDNAPDHESIAEWVPRSGYGHVVITSTRSNWPANFAPSMTTQGFTIDEALEFVASRLDAPLDNWTHAQMAACLELASRLEFWPLALELALAWILRQQGGLGQLRDFVDRLDRLDLDDSSLIPHGYPATARKVVTSLLDDLSEEERTLAVGIFLLGGRRVPRPLLDAWVDKMKCSATVLNELMRFCVATQSLSTDARKPHAYDEMVDMHDAIQLVLRQKPGGVPITSQALLNLVEVCAEQVESLMSGDQFIEAAAILSPVDNLLKDCVTTLGLEKTPVFWTTLMHNMGSLAMVVNRPTNDPGWATRIAHYWLSLAVTIRKRSTTTEEFSIGFAALQIETLGILAVVLQQLENDAELLSVSTYALQVGEPYGSTLNTASTRVPDALNMIRKAVELRGVGDSSVHNRLESLESTLRSSRPPIQNTGMIAELQRKMEDAIQLLDQGSWEKSLNLGLDVTSIALEKGVLVTKCIDGLFDIAVGLITKMVQRPAKAENARQIINQLVAWLRAISTNLTQSQNARFTLLEAISTRDPKTLRRTIADVSQRAFDEEIIQGWVTLAKLLATQDERLIQFTDLPPGLTIHVPSTELLYWEATDPVRNVPILFVYNPGSFWIDSSGRYPTGADPFLAAGLVKMTFPDYSREPIPGWQVQFSSNELRVYTPEGHALVEQVLVTHDLRKHTHQAGGVLLVYCDGDTIPKNQPLTLTAPAGWVSLSRTRHSWWRNFFRGRKMGQDATD